MVDISDSGGPALTAECNIITSGFSLGAWQVWARSNVSCPEASKDKTVTDTTAVGDSAVRARQVDEEVAQ